MIFNMKIPEPPFFSKEGRRALKKHMEQEIKKSKTEERAKAHRLTNAWRLTGKPVHANAEDGTSPC